MKQVSTAEFNSEVLASPTAVVVDFYTDGCPPCRALSPVLEQWEREAGGGLKVVKVDAAAESELAAAYRVQAVPALFLFSNGKCVGQMMGLQSRSALQKWFTESLATAVRTAA